MPEEYISRRDARIAILEKQAGGGLDQKITVGSAEAVINAVPAADVAEVHHARWEEADWREYDAQSGETIRFPKAAIVCSDCRNAFKKGSLRIQSFCPACGAKMDGAAE